MERQEQFREAARMSYSKVGTVARGYTYVIQQDRNGSGGCRYVIQQGGDGCARVHVRQVVLRGHAEGGVGPLHRDVVRAAITNSAIMNGTITNGAISGSAAMDKRSFLITSVSALRTMPQGVSAIGARACSKAHQASSRQRRALRFFVLIAIRFAEHSARPRSLAASHRPGHGDPVPGDA